MRSEARLQRKGKASVEGFLFGLLGGFAAWVATEVLVRPLAKFFALRAEAAEVLARYADRFSLDPNSPSPHPDWLWERKLAYEDCGAKLAAFAISNSSVARLMGRCPLKRFRFHARSAGSNLLGLAETEPGTEASDYFRVRVLSALKISFWPVVQNRIRRPNADR